MSKQQNVKPDSTVPNTSKTIESNVNAENITKDLFYSYYIQVLELLSEELQTFDIVTLLEILSEQKKISEYTNTEKFKKLNKSIVLNKQLQIKLAEITSILHEYDDLLQYSLVC